VALQYARRATIGFAIILCLLASAVAAALLGMWSAFRSESRAREETQLLVKVAQLRYRFEQKVANGRAYIITGDDKLRMASDTAAAAFDSAAAALIAEFAGSQSLGALQNVIRDKRRHDAAFRDAVAARSRGLAPSQSILMEVMVPIREEAASQFQLLEARTRRNAELVHLQASATIRTWTLMVAVATVLIPAAGLTLAVFTSRSIEYRENEER
jgi:CHASE3 domain sensor protein